MNVWVPSAADHNVTGGGDGGDDDDPAVMTMCPHLQTGDHDDDDGDCDGMSLLMTGLQTLVAAVADDDAVGTGLVCFWQK